MLSLAVLIIKRDLYMTFNIGNKRDLRARFSFFFSFDDVEFDCTWKSQ